MRKINNVLAWFTHIFDMSADDVRVLCEFFKSQPNSDYMIAFESMLAMSQD